VSDEYIEDKRYILTFIDDQKKINERLFANDEELKIALSKLVVKIGLVMSGVSLVIGSAMPFVIESFK
jgi:hypothetical protein